MGAINQDEVARVHTHPAPGETVVTNSIDFFPGGKGANQAVAAATAGFDVRVQMLGAVGEDVAGDVQLAALLSAGVDASLVRRVIGTPTGRAYITVSHDGQNSIVVGLGANAFVSQVNLNGATVPEVVIAQTELGSAPIEALAQYARDVGARLVVNDAPVVQLSSRALMAADPLVVNEFEARDLLGRHGADSPGLPPEQVVARLHQVTSSRSVIVTLGEKGSVVSDDDGIRLLPAVAALTVVDTTGAGDIFVGSLAAALAVGHGMDDAVRHATAAASAAVSWRGARTPEQSPAAT